MAEDTLFYRHVLLATDLSDHTDYLAKRAAQIAKATHADLSIVHVLVHMPIAYGGEFTMPIDPAFEADIKKQAREHLAKIGKKYHIPEKAQHLREGSIKTAVIDCAKAIKADLIVVGTHSHRGLEILLGSQANAILHAAHCDVWIIRIQ